MSLVTLRRTTGVCPVSAVAVATVGTRQMGVAKAETSQTAVTTVRGYCPRSYFSWGHLDTERLRRWVTDAAGLRAVLYGL